MGLKDQLQQDLKDAMKAGEKDLRDTLRLLTAAIKQAEVDERKTLSEEDILAILKKEGKRRQESIVDLEKAGRDPSQERLELGIIERYLPAALDPDQIKALAKEAIAEAGASSPKDMGQVMKILMPRLQGAADGKTVNEIVRELLA